MTKEKEIEKKFEEWIKKNYKWIGFLLIIEITFGWFYTGNFLGVIK